MKECTRGSVKRVQYLSGSTMGAQCIPIQKQVQPRIVCYSRDAGVIYCWLQGSFVDKPERWGLCRCLGWGENTHPSLLHRVTCVSLWPISSIHGVICLWCRKWCGGPVHQVAYAAEWPSVALYQGGAQCQGGLPASRPASCTLPVCSCGPTAALKAKQPAFCR